VRIVILPDNEDPDSYVTKYGAEAMRNYIVEKQKDFIYFKTELRLTEINNDPIKKVTLLKELVALIAVIPDPMKRSVYIKEVSRRLDMDEQSLMSEMNKVILGQLQERKRAIERKERLDGTATQSNPYPFSDIDPQEYIDESQFVTERTQVTKQGVTPNKVFGDEFQERDIIRILVAGGDKYFDATNSLTIGEFILTNIQDVLEDFDNKSYEAIAKACMDRLVQGEKISFQFFMNHENESFRKIAVDMTSEEHEYSSNWEEMWHLPLQTQETPDNNFILDATHAIKRFKLHRLMRMCDKNSEQMKAFSISGDMDQMMLAMRVHQKLLEMRNVLAKELGTVILK
jgi:DNA primase